ncbi:MAG: DUF4384 domain-containing protein, partial [Bryobacterales bacterium]|nr:DUF4384 domain-containing protein [Bryobacterales bacterium]
FHSGDRIRLRVEVNDQGYLYVVHRGSSGVWKPLFPSSEIEAGDNRVDAAVSYDIPPGYVFTFDEQPGEEKLFVVFARQPVTDLEKLIYEVGRGRPGEPPAPKAGAEPKVLLAENRIEIGDQVVSELRNAYARDLIIEKVDETTKAPGYAKETAVYAVAPQGAADSRVVVDLSLIHR